MESLSCVSQLGLVAFQRPCQSSRFLTCLFEWCKSIDRMTIKAKHTTFFTCHTNPSHYQHSCTITLSNDWPTIPTANYNVPIDHKISKEPLATFSAEVRRVWSLFILKLFHLHHDISKRTMPVNPTIKFKTS